MRCIICRGYLSGFRSFGHLIRDAYTSDWLAEFVITHLRGNDNRLPGGWDDLIDEVDTL